MPTARLNGADIAYDDQGSGPPIVLIHGYPLSRRTWQSQLAGLSGCRVIALDLRGHGESPSVAEPATMDTHAGDLHTLLDHLAIDRAVICGFSMGGYVAFAFLRKYPERLRGLVLAATQAAADSPEAKQGRAQAAQLARDKGATAIADALLPRLLSEASLAGRPGLVTAVRAVLETTPVDTIVADLGAMAERPDAGDLLPGIKVPTLVLTGALDKLMPPAAAPYLAEHIPGARLHTVPDAAHMLAMENPLDFNRALSDFLATI